MPTPHTNEIPCPSHTAALSDSEYVRARLAPRRRDVNYVHLKDLADFLRSAAPAIRGEVFDYGCGGAPYRSLFAHCRRYLAADIEANPAVDCVLEPNGTTGQADASFDAVLSTQVLEHIQDPDAYLREAQRILRPGGQLLLTTHGMFEEHGCPHDFLRWTSRGLDELVTKNGFRVSSSHKLSTELRGYVQLSNQMALHWRCPDQPLLHYPLAVLRKTHGLIGVPLLNWFADRFPRQAVVSGSDSASLYVCVAVRAFKG